jgi:hypothetical protein
MATRAKAIWRALDEALDERPIRDERMHRCDGPARSILFRSAGRRGCAGGPGPAAAQGIEFARLAS